MVLMYPPPHGGQAQLGGLHRAAQTATVLKATAEMVKRDSDAPTKDRVDMVRFFFPESDHPLPSTEIWQIHVRNTSRSSRGWIFLVYLS